MHPSSLLRGLPAFVLLAAVLGPLLLAAGARAQAACVGCGPQPGITLVPVAPRAGEEVRALAEDPSGESTFAWDLDDDGIFDDATGASATLRPASGEHRVAVRARDGSGRAAVRRRTFSVRAAASGNVAPRAVLDVPPTARVGRPSRVLVTATDTDDPAPRVEVDADGDGTYEIDRPGGAFLPMTVVAVEVRHARPGSRTVRARVTDRHGRTTTSTGTVDVRALDAAPTVRFTPGPGRRVPVGRPLELFVSAADEDGTVARIDADGDGDGTFETPAPDGRFTVVPRREGALEVVARATDDEGATATARTRVAVTASTSPPVVERIGIDTDEGVSSAYAEAADDDGSIVEYAWDLDADGAFDDGSGADARIDLGRLDRGEHEVGVQVTDDDGATDRLRAVLSTASDARVPAVLVDVPYGTQVGREAVLEASVAGVAPEAVREWAWDLDDDGAFDDAHGARASVHHDAVGDRRVTARARLDHGETVQAAAVYTVGERAAELQLHWYPPNTQIGRGWSVSSYGRGFAEERWDFDGDGVYGEADEPTVPTRPGVHEVGVEVRSTETGVRRRRAEITVPPRAVPARLALVAPTTVEQGAFLKLEAETDGCPTTPSCSYVWDLDADGAFDDHEGDGFVGSFHYEWFQRLGLHRYRVRQTDAHGAVTEASAVVDVRPVGSIPSRPLRLELQGPRIARAGRDVQLLPVPYGALGDPERWRYAWDLDGDGDFDDGGGAPRAVPAGPPGVRTVRVRLTDGAGRVAEQAIELETRATNVPPAVRLAVLADPRHTGTSRYRRYAGVRIEAEDPDGDGPWWWSGASLAWDVDGDGAYGDEPQRVEDGVYVFRRELEDTRTITARVRDRDGGETYRSVDLAPADDELPPQVAVSRAGGAPGEGGAAIVGRPVELRADAVDPDAFLATSRSPDDRWYPPDRTIAWDLDGDGRFDDAGGPTASATFDREGVHAVRARVVDLDGRSAVDELEILVTAGDERGAALPNRAPRADAVWVSGRPVAGRDVVFRSVSTDPDGRVAELAWDLDDDGHPDARGTTATARFAAGDRRVRIRAVDDDGASAETVLRLDVVDGAPRVRIGRDQDRIIAGRTVALSADAADADGRITAIRWDLDGDGAHDDAVGPRTTTRFYSPGTRRLGVLVTDDDGRSTETAETVDVLDRASVLTKELRKGTTEPIVGQPVRLWTLEEHWSEIPERRYAWDLDDDGSPDDAVGPARAITTTFDEPGEHRVTVWEQTPWRADVGAELVVRVKRENAPPMPRIHTRELELRRDEGSNTAFFGFVGVVHDEDDARRDETGRYDDGIVRWEWDLDGDGRFDGAADASGPQVSRHYGAGATGITEHVVRLRATDRSGGVGTETIRVRTLPARDAPPPADPPPSPEPTTPSDPPTSNDPPAPSAPQAPIVPAWPSVMPAGAAPGAGSSSGSGLPVGAAGTPGSPPSPGSPSAGTATSGLRARLNAPARLGRAAFARGPVVRAGCSARCTLVVDATVSARDARRLRIPRGSRRVAQRRVSLDGGASLRVRLRPSAGVGRRARRGVGFTLIVRARGAGVGGVQHAVARRIRVR